MDETLTLCAECGRGFPARDMSGIWNVTVGEMGWYCPECWPPDDEDDDADTPQS